MKKKRETALEKDISRIFRTHSMDVQFNILDLPKISEIAKQVHAEGKSLQEMEMAIIDAIAQFRKN